MISFIFWVVIFLILAGITAELLALRSIRKEIEEDLREE